MCGICGIYSLDKPADEGVLRRMNDLISHRGPDDEGSRVFNNQPPFVALANRRLSILDLSSAGHQPMSNERQTVWITYNGEIYNYLELREELLKLGHQFCSGTDTEVIIHSYEEWGIDCLKHFNGMWAFAIWDADKEQLFCARDYFGIKPFYYYWNGKYFIFASEIKPIIAHPDVAKKVNEEILYDYLTTGFVDHTENTFFAGIKQLRSSHYLILNSSNQMQIRRWWDIDQHRTGNLNSKTREDDIIAQFRELLEDSVRLRLRSDVPVGTCLSGGLDSSSIVCLINRLLLQHKVVRPELIGAHQKAFSACYEDFRIDERQFINPVIKQTSAESHLIFPNGKGLWDDLNHLVRHQEEPFRSTSMYAQYCVMRLVAQKGVKVLLDGQGADELLGGYFNYPGVLLTQLFTQGKFMSAYNEWRRSVFTTPWQKTKLLLFVVYSLFPSFIRSLARSSLSELLPERASIRNKPFGARPEWASKFSGRTSQFYEKRFRYAKDLNKMLYVDIFEYGLPALLRHEDKNSSAFSLEARVPFLDHRLVEFAFSLGTSYKIRDGWTKWLLRESMKGIIPDEIAYRRDKIGFATPEITWLKENRNNIYNLFNKSTILSEKFVSPFSIRNNLDSMLVDDKIKFTDIWRWVNLEAWLQSFFA